VNPIDTMGFWLMVKLKAETAVGYVLAQLEVRLLVRCHF
jgi:hypothetical protein